MSDVPVPVGSAVSGAAPDLRGLRDKLSARGKLSKGLPALRLEAEMGWLLDTDVVNEIHHHLPGVDVRRAFLVARELDACPIIDPNPRGIHSLVVALAGEDAQGHERTRECISVLMDDYVKPRLEQLGILLENLLFMLVSRTRYMELKELAEPGEAAVKLRRERLRELDPEASARGVFPRIVHRAAELGASDIHIEPRSDRYVVRMRCQSVLTLVYTLRPTTGAALVNVIKTCAALNIAENRLPQDGRITLAQQPMDVVPAEYRALLNDISLRVATVPTVIRDRGEKVVLRLLKSGSTANYRLSNLGFPERALADLLSVIQSPHGMLLVTGPTGSGKTTTLYSVLAELNDGTLNISTAEDPVEARFDNMDQCQVDEAIGRTFAVLQRSFLRQDPDCILVGEIRDPETAAGAVQAARTGHLLLSTLHTLDSYTAFPRLRELGIGAPTLASCLSAVLAQRLVRELCPVCVESYDPADELNELLGETIIPSGVLEFRYPSVSSDSFCERCGNSGYVGMIPVVEVWVPSDEERHAMIYDPNVTHESLAAMAFQRGVSSMGQTCLDLIRAGRTTVAEMLRAVCSAHEFRRDPLLSVLRKVAKGD